MNTDRELLELAAKAAGLAVLAWNTEIPALVLIGPTAWNPLADDGDALRLAVKLRFLVEVSCDGHEVRANSPDGYHYTAICGNDAYASTRRAIVKCASYIGKNQ